MSQHHIDDWCNNCLKGIMAKMILLLPETIMPCNPEAPGNSVLFSPNIIILHQLT